MTTTDLMQFWLCAVTLINVILIHLILVIIMSWYCDYAHFSDVGTENQEVNYLAKIRKSGSGNHSVNPGCLDPMSTGHHFMLHATLTL
jgi:hypothetical protein